MFNLIASGRYTYVIDAINYYSDWYNSNWNNTNLEHIRLLNEALKSNPALVTNTTDEAFAYLQQGGYIYPTQDDTYEMYTTQSMCDLYRFSSESVPFGKPTITPSYTLAAGGCKSIRTILLVKPKSF
uniref:Uncharacterized protein n=1 Tax=Acrobeloides nanus TaxID=290746 RepID=A0A914CY58_9BILA